MADFFASFGPRPCWPLCAAGTHTAVCLFRRDPPSVSLSVSFPIEPVWWCWIDWRNQKMCSSWSRMTLSRAFMPHEVDAIGLYSSEPLGHLCSAQEQCTMSSTAQRPSAHNEVVHKRGRGTSVKEPVAHNVLKIGLGYCPCQHYPELLSSPALQLKHSFSLLILPKT